MPATKPPRPTTQSGAADPELADTIKWLASVTDEPRMEKAVAMLKKASFQLFADLTQDELLGVVRSQKDSDLFYSGFIRADGHFCCVNQKLELCRGMLGYPCKHLLVLMVGLAQAKRLPPATIRAWVTQATNLPARSRVLQDNEKLSATFLRYKGSQAGDQDWRPTETIPEDFYAL